MSHKLSVSKQEISHSEMRQPNTIQIVLVSQYVCNLQTQTNTYAENIFEAQLLLYCWKPTQTY